MKRKRSRKFTTVPVKRQRLEQTGDRHPTSGLLKQYYPRVASLREYLVSALRKHSKRRSRKVLNYGRDAKDDSEVSIVNEHVCELLDEAIVGVAESKSVIELASLQQDISIFTQQITEPTALISATQSTLKQSELVDFTIWSLFRRCQHGRRPPHMLCHGFQTTMAGAGRNVEPIPVPGIPGVFSFSKNVYVARLKSSPWPELYRLLGKGADIVMHELLMQHGLFLPVANSSNLLQISGVPLSECKVLDQQQTDGGEKYDRQLAGQGPGQTKQRGMTEIRFVRQRILYARTRPTSTGRQRCGLDGSHALERFPNVDSHAETIHLSKYFFPWQYGLHNAFVSAVDFRNSAQSFMDYTMREDEIARALPRQQRSTVAAERSEEKQHQNIPRRLRSQAMLLVARTRRRHARCAYAGLLDHFCPKQCHISSSSDTFQHAVSHASVSAFCRSATLRVFPRSFFDGPASRHNTEVLLRSIDRFVRLRRYEGMTMHDVLQGMVIDGIDWLPPPNIAAEDKLCQTDYKKRQELFAELLYYVFDSFLIPLIRSHFYVTESSIHRNQLLFFRHDVWHHLSAPAITSLKDTMLEEYRMNAKNMDSSKRALGTSTVRLLPKEQGMRPIINLRRRVQRLQRGEKHLGKSINSLLSPAFDALNYEKAKNPHLLGSALFSVEDMFGRLQDFRQSLERKGLLGKPLYLAKVDVAACFDTIPQKQLLRLVETIMSEDSYRSSKYARSKLIGGHNEHAPSFGAKPSWRFLTKAVASREAFDFAKEAASDSAQGRTRTVFVDGIVQRTDTRKSLMALLEEHIESNIVQIGNRAYRQKRGIPQGSVVSSILCSCFYAELERQRLPFIDGTDTVLLRLIDDFLIISVDRDIAARFLRTMHAGISEFGVEVKSEKSRANFDIEIHGRKIASLPSICDFPYCGNTINSVSLNLSKDRLRRLQSNISESVTVEHSKLPGQSFYRKMLSALKLQMHAMLLSTKYNSATTVFRNLFHSFTEVAQKTYHYINAMAPGQRPHGELVIRAVNDVIKLACVLMKARKRKVNEALSYECAVKHAQARW